MRKLIVFLSLIVCSIIAFADPYQAPPKAQLFVVLFEPGPSWVAGQPMAKQNLREHVRYHGQMVKDGRTFAAGGFAERDGGMAIFRAKDIEEAQGVIAADPAVRNGVFKAQLRHWQPRFVSNEPLAAPSL